MGFQEQNNNGAFDGTTPVTIVAAPSGGLTRVVKNITIQNRDTVSNTITVRYLDGASTRQVWSGSLSAGDTLFIDEVYVLDESDKSITGVMGGAATTTNPDFTSHYSEVSGTQSILSLEDTVANRPASAAEGTLFLETDGYSIDRWDGSSWGPWGPVYSFTAPPADSNFSWINQDTATTSEVNGGIYLTNDTGNGNALGINLRLISISGSWTLTTASIPNLAIGVNTLTVPAAAYESGTQKLCVMHFHTTTGGAVGMQRYSTPTTGEVNILGYTQGTHLFVGGVWWSRLVNNGTNIIGYYSGDGVNWRQAGSVAVTTAFTTAPDRIGFGVHPFNGAAGIRLLHWSVT